MRRKLWLWILLPEFQVCMYYFQVLSLKCNITSSSFAWYKNSPHNLYTKSVKIVGVFKSWLLVNYESSFQSFCSFLFANFECIKETLTLNLIEYMSYYVYKRVNYVIVIFSVNFQGVQCKDCRYNAHKKCSEKVPRDCTGEIPQVRLCLFI